MSSSGKALTGRVGSCLCSSVSLESGEEEDESCSAAASLFAMERWSSIQIARSASRHRMDSRCGMYFNLLESVGL